MNIYLSLIVLILSVACNKVTFEMTPASQMQVDAPAQMFTGRCSKWSIAFKNKTGATAKLAQASTINLSLLSSGVPVSGAEFYSDANCSLPISSLSVAAGAQSASVYVIYNLKQDVALEASTAALGSASASRSMDMDFLTNDRIAGFALLSGGNYEGIGSEARLSAGGGVATDGSYVYMTSERYNTIIKINIATRQMTYLAGAPGYGSYSAGYADGFGEAAKFNSPHGLVLHGGDLYVADYSNHVLRKVNVTTGEVTTVAGTAGVSGNTDAVGSLARLNGPVGITSDGTNIYFSDYGGQLIRKFDPATGAVTTIAGTYGAAGTADGVGAAATFSNPFYLGTDGTYIYVPDSSSHIIRQVEISSGTVTTIAGSAGVAGSADGTGVLAKFNTPTSAKFHGGFVYITDQSNNTIRKLDPGTGVVTTVAGTAGSNGFNNGTFAASLFSMPRDLDVSGTHIYVSEYWGGAVRDLDMMSSMSSSLVGAIAWDDWTAADGVGSSAGFAWVDMLASDGTYLYIPNGNVVQRMHIATRVVETIAGQIGVAATLDGVGTAATFNYPTGVAVSGNTLYVADSSDSVIRKIDLTTRAVTTIAGTAGASGSADGVGAAARFSWPEGIELVGTDLYIFEYTNHTVRKLDTLTNTVTTFAGQTGVGSEIDGIGTAATFNGVDAGVHVGGFLYVIDYRAHTIRKINLATAEVTAFAGTINTCGKVDGVGAAAQFCFPYAITTDGTYLYVSDNSTDSIRKIDIATAEVTTLAGVTHRSKDTTGPYATTPLYAPTGIVWTPSGLFFANNGHSISWFH